MSGWVLFQHGRRRPPRSGGRRIAVAIVVFAASAALLPFVVIGVVEAAGNARAIDAMIFGFLGLLLVVGVVAPIVSIVGLVRERRQP